MMGIALNEKSCNGACTNTQNDAKNCGDCGVVCAAGQHCGGGTCR